MAIAAGDGSVSICHLAANPGEEVRIDQLQAPASTDKCVGLPEAAVMDISWSFANDFLVSASLDGALNLWSFDGVGSEPPVHTRTLSPIQLATGGLLACDFHPGNNNLLVIAGTKGNLAVRVSSMVIIKPEQPFTYFN